MLLYRFLGHAFAAGAKLNTTALQSCAASMNGALTGSEPIDFHFTGVVRRHYISAEEITWDYAPTGFDNWLGVPFNLSPRAQAANYTEFGTKWQKAVYRGYTDSNFTTLAPQPPWQGIQGPTIRAEVGDMIEILFVNRLTNNFATLHSKGLAYGKDSEGTTYPNNTSQIGRAHV